LKINNNNYIYINRYEKIKNRKKKKKLIKKK